MVYLSEQNISSPKLSRPKHIPACRSVFSLQVCKLQQNLKQAGAELGQAQVKLDDLVEVVVDVEVIGVVKVEV